MICCVSAPLQLLTFPGPQNYVLDFQHQYKHLTSTGFGWKHGSRRSPSSKLSTPIRRLDSRSMVRASGSPAQKKPSRPSAGQASSPRDTHKNSATTLSVTSTVVSPGTENKQTKAHQSRPSSCSSTPSVKSGLRTARAAAEEVEEAGDSDTSEDSCSSVISSDMNLSDLESPPTSPEPDWPHESALERKKRELVDIGMAVFNEAFHATLAQLEFGHDSGNGSGSHQPGKPSTSKGKSGNQQPLGGQKRQLIDSDDDGADDLGDGNFGDRNGNKRAKKTAERRFACPYFKHNPDRYRNERTCCGPGWTTVHRLKEHLLRRHALPKHLCLRCYKTFKSEAEYGDHQRAATRCPLERENPWDGYFDQATQKILRSRQKASSPEVEKWKDVYRLLFPGDHVPSPFYDDDEGECGGGPRKVLSGGKRGGPELVEYERYLLREMPARVRRELEFAVEQELNCVEENMKNKAIEIFKNLELKLLRDFADRAAAAAGGGGDRRSSSP
ncbi:hypothetical protein QBC33DRAFT_464203, partial [Phialemonium atrogriseum]